MDVPSPLAPPRLRSTLEMRPANNARRSGLGDLRLRSVQGQAAVLGHAAKAVEIQATKVRLGQWELHDDWAECLMSPIVGKVGKGRNWERKRKVREWKGTGAVHPGPTSPCIRNCALQFVLNSRAQRCNVPLEPVQACPSCKLHPTCSAPSQSGSARMA
eukprot:1154627-Pelagomonas_calceolata.AAC.1